MPVIVNSVCLFEVFLSKEGRRRLNVFVYTHNKAAWIVRSKVLMSSSNNTQKISNRGIAASKSDVGDRHELSSGGGNITMINYYGAQYSQAHANPSVQMDPEKFTKPLTDLALAGTGPALKSPNVEEAGYSDRIMQITAGNSTLTTQEAAQAIVGYGVWPDYDVGVGHAIDKETKPGPAVERFYTLDSIYWNQDWKGRVIRLPGALTDLGMFGQNCQFHFLMRSGFCVHVQVNASKFHQGMLLVAMVPEAQHPTIGTNDNAALSDETLAEIPVPQLTLFPHQLINLRTNNSATIIYPYTNCTPAENALTHNFVSLYIVPIVPLKFEKGASTTIPVTVSISPMFAEFSGLRNRVVAQGVPTFQIPGSGQFVTTIKNDGFPALPHYQETPLHFIPGEVTNLLEVCQIDTFANLGTSELSFTIDVSNQTSVGGKIKDFDMSLNSTVLSTTYLSKCARWYTHYRGSVNLTFMFCGSAMATGKILIAYTPPGGDAPATRKDAMLATHVVWDLGLQSSVTFTVPYISQSQYRYNNIDGNIFSYDGFISMFYQTNIVVPPGAPSTCQIVLLVSAAKDFTLRLATDSAYFQGLGEDLGNLVNGSVQTTAQQVLRPATGLASEVPNTLSIHTGESGILTAPETGASSTTEAGAMIETRSVSTMYSAAETSIEAFMSRYAMFSAFDLRTGSTAANGEYRILDLRFSEESSTHKALVTKYRMFTYLRMGYDVVAIVSPKANVRDRVHMSSPPKFQMMFIPPGCPAPRLVDGPEWYLPTTPSVYFSVDQPPASLRLPYMGVMSTFASRYDGFYSFQTTNPRSYGYFPGNDIGKLAIRAVTDGVTANSDLVDYRVVIFARPTMIRAWLPRPIKSLKTQASVSRSKGRVIFTDDDDADQLLIGQGYMGTDLKVSNRGPHPTRRKITHIPRFAREALQTTWLAWDTELRFSFHIFPVSQTDFIAPFHLFNNKLVFAPYGDDDFLQIPYTAVRCDLEHDLVLGRMGRPIFTRTIRLAKPEQAMWFACDNSDHSYGEKHSSWSFVSEIHVDEPFPHTQRDLISFPHPIPFGLCGSPLLTRDGIVAMATAGSDSVSYFTNLHLVEWLNVEPLAEEQGISDWFSDFASQLGSAFGEGAAEQVADKVQGMISTSGIAQLPNAACKDIMVLLTKILCACVIISKSEDVLASAVSVGVMVGVDFLTTSPFTFLRQKVAEMCSLVYAEEQGPSDWIKEFNAACTAAKGLEWIGDKLSKFVEWVRKMFEKEDRHRKKFMKQLEDLPLLMESIDKIMAARGQYRDEDVRRICGKMRQLKLGADIYGVQRNQATHQIVKYYQKAMSILQAMTQGRSEPVALLVHGTPGTGKSLATEIIGRALTQKLGGNRPYSLPPDPKHFDGYAQQPVVIMDDVGQNPDGEDLKLFCQMVSSTEFVVPMAALEEKGMSFTSKFVLASTNCNMLSPPTIAEPAALKRRFFLDLFIEVDTDYKRNDKLTANTALDRCSHPATNFKHCCPLICGKAIRLKDMRTMKMFTLDEVVSMLYAEHLNRQGCGSKLEAIFQGPGTNDIISCEWNAEAKRRGVALVTEDEWFETDYDKEESVLMTIEEQRARGIEQPKPAPKEIADLLMAVPTEEVIKYCRAQGWLIPAGVTIKRTKASTMDWIKKLSYGLSILSSLTAVCGFIYMLYKIFASVQGPYTGTAQKALKKPELKRKAVAQGPDLEFAQKLMNSNVIPVETQTGAYSALAMYDTWLLLPKHSQPGETVSVDGQVHDVLDMVELENTQGSLELVAVKIDRPTKYRDIRRYIPDHFSTESDCMLVINNKNFSRMFCPVGRVTAFGFLNLSCKPTYNTCTYRYPTKSGQCGGVVCKSGKIIGLHIGGDGLNGYGAILTKRIVGAIEQGAIVRKEKTPFKPINLNSKTKFHPSVFFDVFPGTKEPAALHPKDRRLEVDLDGAMFAKHKGNTDIPIDEELGIAIDHYTEQIRPLMPINLTEPLTMEEVVYGTDNLEGLDLSTSAGFPYVIKNTRKRDLIPERGQPLTKLLDALDLYGYDLPYVTYLKDELRPIDKVRKGKTRLIECSSMNDTIRMKTTFGRLFQTFHANPGTVTGSAVGCNPDLDWSKFYAEMGDNPLIAYDYSNFDASLGSVWFEALKQVLRKLGYNEEQLKCIDHVKNSTHLYKDIVYEVEGGMPSGCSGTSIFNSIINNLIIRTLVLKSYKSIDLDRLRIIAYGDDVIISYPHQLDAAALAECGKDYNLTMTPADKSDTFNEVTWDNVTFLKRRFVPDKHFPFLVHPVFPMEEIMDSIRWTKSAANTQQHVTSLCLLAWHNGQEVYEDFVEKVRSVPVGRALHLPPYSALYREWLDQF